MVSRRISEEEEEGGRGVVGVKTIWILSSFINLSNVLHPKIDTMPSM